MVPVEQNTVVWLFSITRERLIHTTCYRWIKTDTSSSKNEVKTLDEDVTTHKHTLS